MKKKEALEVVAKALAEFANETQPAAFLVDNRSVFGELADEPRFVGVYLGVLESLRSRGVRATLADLDRFAL